MLKPTQNKIASRTLRLAGVLFLCASLTACTAGSAAGGIFSFDIMGFLSSITSRYTTDNYTSTTSASTVESSSTATASSITVVTTLQYLPTQGEEEDTAQSVSEAAWVDYTSADQGYVMVQYLGEHTGQVKLQITGPTSLTYTFDLTAGAGFEVFPLTEGTGDYTLNIYEQDSGTSYYLVDSITFAAAPVDDFVAYLYPNQYVNYTQGSDAQALSIEAATGAVDELDLVAQIYGAVMDAVDYDYDLAELIASGGLSSYIPDLDSVIATEAGICFDYASLMVAMLRMQEVPAKLVIGYAGEAYHAWINVYTEEDGWIDSAIYFDGETWVLMDPTFADTSGSNDYVGDGESYTAKYVY